MKCYKGFVWMILLLLLPGILSACHPGQESSGENPDREFSNNESEKITEDPG